MACITFHFYLSGILKSALIIIFLYEMIYIRIFQHFNALTYCFNNPQSINIDFFQILKNLRHPDSSIN